MDEHLLRRNAVRLCGEPVKEDALVRRVLVDDVETLCALGNDVGEINLPNGEEIFLHLRALLRTWRCGCRSILRGKRRSLLVTGSGNTILRHTQVDALSAPLHRLVDGLWTDGRHGVVVCACVRGACARALRSVWRPCTDAQGYGFAVKFRLFNRCRNRRRLPRRAANRVEHGLIDRLEDAPLILELHLRFLRMHIHINRPLRDLDAENREGEAHLRHERTVNVVNRLCNRTILNRTPIDDIGLPCAAAADHGRLRDVARDANLRLLIVEVEGNQRTRRIAAVDALNGAAQTVIARRHDGESVVVDEAECDIGTRKCEANHIVADPPRLGRIRLEEFLARRRIEKKILNAHGRPDLTARLLNCGRLSAEDIHTRTEIVRCFSREERKA